MSINIAKASGNSPASYDYDYDYGSEDHDAEIRRVMLYYMGLFSVPAALGAALGAIALGMARAGGGGRWRARAVAGVFVVLSFAYVAMSVAYQCKYRDECDTWLDTTEVRESRPWPEMSVRANDRRTRARTVVSAVAS